MQLCFRILTLSVKFATIDSATVMKGLDRRGDEDLKDEWTNGYTTRLYKKNSHLLMSPQARFAKTKNSAGDVLSLPLALLVGS